MGGIVSSLFGTGAIGGSSAKRDRSEQLDAYGDLRNTFNWALPFGQQQGRTGQATTAAGVGDLGQAGGYFRKLASGDRPTALSAIAPQTNAAIAQSDAQKQQLGEMGTARGGGTSGLNQQRDTQLMSQIDNMLFGAQAGGAEGLAKVGEAESGVGLGETGQGIQAGAVAGRTAGELGQQALQSRGLSEQIHQQHVSQISGGLEDTLTGVFKALGLG
jgi:hypothetical protein